MSTTKAPPKFTVSQKVIVTNGRGGFEESMVATVGRVYVVVGEGWRLRKFRIEDGAEATDIGPGRIFTEDEWADRLRRDELAQKLYLLGIAPAGFGGFKHDSDTLQRIVEAIENPS